MPSTDNSDAGAQPSKDSRRTQSSDAPPPLSSTIRDSAQQIWQGGLGAFAKAQAEGSKAFESLVKEGNVFQRHAPEATAQGLQDAARRMASVAEDLSARATGQWDKLENIFEQRVAKALQRLEVPSSDELQALQARVEALEKQLQATKAAKSTKVASTQPRKAAPHSPRKASATAAAPRAPRKRAARPPAG